MTATDDLKQRRKRNPKLVALNTAYGILMAHAPCLADNVPLDGLANAIADAILKGATKNGPDANIS